MPLSARRVVLGFVLATAVLAPLVVGRARGRAEEAPGTTRVDSVRDVKLPDLDGKAVGLSDVREAKALVLAWTAPGCPVAEVQAPRLKALAEESSAKGVRFLG